MQGKNISIVESNTPRYDCHAGRAGHCPHSHSYRGPSKNNRHICKDCAEENLIKSSFKAEKPRFPSPFKIQDISIYSTKLNKRDVKKYDDLKPILMAEGRRPPPAKKTRGMQAGEDDFSDDEQYKGLHKMTLEFQMVIFDWANTPIFHILTRKMDVLRSLIKYCNKTTLNKLAGDLRERNEFEERSLMRARR